MVMAYSEVLKNIINKALNESVDELIAHHGSGANFDEFDLSKNNTGAGSNAFGYGVYVTSSAKIGADYARIAQGLVLCINDYPVWSSKDDYHSEQNFDNPYRVIFDLFQTEKSWRKALNMAQRLQSMVEPDNKRAYYLWGRAIQILKNTRANEWHFKKEQIVYQVDIPDDNGSNYLPWYEKPSPSVAAEIMMKLGVRDMDLIRYNVENCKSYAMLYRSIASKLGGEKEASEFLYKIGFDGIVYPAGTLMGGNARKGDINYVVFNAKDVRIINKERKLK